MATAPKKIERSAAKRISIYNHKGGVGKTTLTFNLASQLAKMGKRVLVVDSDPQCNLTSYVIDTEVLDDLLDKSDTNEGVTVWSAVRPIVEGTGPAKNIAAFELSGNTKRYLLPGDIRLSDFESDLSDFWRDCLTRKRKGFSGTTALSQVVNNVCLEHEIDFVFYDTGPNIGPLNRIILLDCDYFIIPVAYDLFSVRALKTLGRSLFTWVNDWRTICQLAPDEIYLLPGSPKFLGYIPQNFAIYRGTVASQHAKYAPLLDKGINADIVSILKTLDLIPAHKSHKLGELKDFGQLVAASQKQGVPIYEVDGGSQDQREVARIALKTIAEKIVKQAI